MKLSRPKPMTIERQEKLAKGFQRAFWAGEAVSIGLNIGMEFTKSAQMRAAGQLVVRGSELGRAMKRSQALLTIAGLYYATKLFSKYGKRSKLLWPNIKDSKFLELSSRTVNVLTTPTLLKEVGLAALQRERDGGLGGAIKVVETDSATDKRKAKVSKVLDRYSKGLEGVSLGSLTLFFGVVSKRQANLANYETLVAGGINQAVKGLRRKQALAAIGSLYWFARLIGSRRGNMEKLFPRLKENAAWNGVAAALGLIASPWRVGAAFLEIIATQDRKKPESDLPPRLAEADKPSAPTAAEEAKAEEETPTLKKSDVALAS